MQIYTHVKMLNSEYLPTIFNGLHIVHRITVTQFCKRLMDEINASAFGRVHKLAALTDML